MDEGDRYFLWRRCGEDGSRQQSRQSECNSPDRKAQPVVLTLLRQGVTGIFTAGLDRRGSSIRREDGYSLHR
jgi:hypothetical protein